MNITAQREVSRKIPIDIPERFLNGGTPVFVAYECVLVERYTGRSYVYTTVNLASGKSEIISRRTNPLTAAGVPKIVEKMRKSTVAGAGHLEADRRFRERITFEQCHEIMVSIFNEILPLHGYAIRKPQIELAEHILESIRHRHITLAEAEVGTGKTLAYLIPAILAKRGRLNDYWNAGFYVGTPYAEMANMPIVVATSSIALQKALVTDFIPSLSKILLSYGIIKTPLTAVIRKGREHYVCRRNLEAAIRFEYDPKTNEILNSLTKPGSIIDIAEIDGITPHIRRKISVPERCSGSCPYRDTCSYLRFRERAGLATIDIQVCNHNYLMADVLRRTERQTPLIPNYQSIIIDEAHKFLSAARSMYGSELRESTLQGIKDSVCDIALKDEELEKLARIWAKKLTHESGLLFRRLSSKACDEDESCSYTDVIDAGAEHRICNIRDISSSLIRLLSTCPASDFGKRRITKILYELNQVRDITEVFINHRELICWPESNGGENRLCAIPKDVDRRLYNDLWSKKLPIILTSGTLSASGARAFHADFSRIKKLLGLESLGSRLTEISKPSPFNYRKNALLYISKNVPFPNPRDMAYIDALADETEKLLYASHGHAAILFTSYKVMDMVWAKIKERDLPFPMFRLDRGGIREIDKFKQSGNGVLFAAGAFWEGIDIPGDALSLLIIIKLPFPAPDAISRYERSRYKNKRDYKNYVIIPDMLIKLKQGYGRPFRKENDTGVVAIFDCRLANGAFYRKYTLKALPFCPVTDDLAVLASFIRSCKPPEYFG